MLRRADRLRRSLVPSLLGARQTNESLANPVIELFEIANVYLPQPASRLPSEELMLALTSGGDFFAVKGVVEGLMAALNPAAQVKVAPTAQELFEADRSAELLVRHQQPTGRKAANCCWVIWEKSAARASNGSNCAVEQPWPRSNWRRWNRSSN